MPPASLSGDYQPGIDQLLHHNATTPYMSEHYIAEDSGYMHSGQSTAYGSPAGTNWLADQQPSDHQHNPYQQLEHEGLGIDYEWYGNLMDAQQHAGPYHNISRPGSTYPDPRFQGGSPPTPTTSDLSDRTTRSGRPMIPSGSARTQRTAQEKSRLSGSPRVRKSAKLAKGDKPKVPKIDAPLSVLTKGYTHIPVRNMDEWVNRSAEVRNREVEKRNGYVTRPMNSFMLYRSAYAERTKLWCLQNNHQVVSSVCGESWPMEPPEIREQYNEYARIERDNHQKAHPGYKFSPSKNQSSARKRKSTPDDSDDDGTIDTDEDSEWRPAGGDGRLRTKSSKRLGREAGYPVNSTLQSEADFGLQASGLGYNRSSYQVINPGKPLPAAMDELELYGHYYQTTVHPSSTVPNVEDVRIRIAAKPGAQPGNAPPLIGLPGAHHYELLDHDSLVGNTTMSEPQVDPSLLGYDGDYVQQPSSFFTEQQFHDFNEDALFGTTSQHYGQRGTGNTFHSESGAWKLEEARPKDEEEDFARWMEANNDR